MPDLAPTIEAILYLKGKPLSLDELAEYAGCDREMATAAVMELMDDYAHRQSALEVVETGAGYSLQLRSAFNSLLATLVPGALGVGALRTLAAIAIQQKIKQSDLIQFRGSGAYQHIPELVELGFVKKSKESDGRSYWLSVTDKFYQYFEIDENAEFLIPHASISSDSPNNLDSSDGSDSIAPEDEIDSDAETNLEIKESPSI